MITFENDLVPHKSQTVLSLGRSDCTVLTMCSFAVWEQVHSHFLLAMKVDCSNLRVQKYFTLYVFGGVVEREYYSVSCL